MNTQAEYVGRKNKNVGDRRDTEKLRKSEP